MKNLVFVIFLVTILIACNKSEIQPDMSSSEKNMDKKISLMLKEKYGIKEITQTIDGSYIFVYENRNELVAIPNGENSFILKGSKLGNKIMKIYKSNEISEIPYQLSVISNDNTILSDNPCSQHPKNESFDQCFKREWNAFCDDFVSCIAQITNPMPIVIAISIHCKICN
jgi:hypothetical protein